MNRPFIVIAISFSTGIVFSYIGALPLSWYILCALVFLLILFLFRTYTYLFTTSLCLVSLCTGASYYAVYESSFLRNIPSSEVMGKPLWIIGTVTKPDDFFRDPSSQSFLMHAEGIMKDDFWVAYHGTLLVKKWGLKKRIRYGEYLAIKGIIKTIDTRNRRFHGIFYSRKSYPLDILSGKREYKVLRIIHRIREYILTFIKKYLHQNSQGIISAILLGERGSISKDTKQLFKKTGTMHLLAISGLHTGIVALVCIAILHGIRFPARLIWILTALFLIVYALLTGYRMSVVRSVVMGELFLIGLIVNREIDVLNSLALAALVILIFSPVQLFDIGFQLSFTAVFWICIITPIIKNFLISKIPRILLSHRQIKKIYYYVIMVFSVSLSAWIGTAPLIAYYFGIFTPISLVSNLFLIPLTFIIVCAGICFLAVGLPVTPLAPILADAVSVLVKLLQLLLKFFESIPIGYFEMGRMPRWWVLLFYGSLILLTLKRKGEKARGQTP